jgi:hypothetical protein
MLSDVMAHFGLTKSLRHVDYFETEHHRQLLKDLKAAIHEAYKGRFFETQVM